MLASLVLWTTETNKETYEQLDNDEKISVYYETVATDTVVDSSTESYVGILTIPTINLKRGFYAYDSSLNDVDKNIEWISKNCYPDESCNFVLAAHSGSSPIAYFKNLEDLVIGDLASIDYMGKTFNYQLMTVQHILKNNSLTLLENGSKALILTTCNKLNNQVQDVYYFAEII